MFENYRERMERMGGSIREANLRQSVKIMEAGFSDSYATRTVQVVGEDTPREARIISDSKTTMRGGNGNYTIQFRDGFYPPAGTYVDIPDVEGVMRRWLIMYESDATVFPKHMIQKCNYLLKWKNNHNEIVERWCVVSDNSKLVEGERKTNYNKMAVPYYSTTLILPCDSETINVDLNKRFLIDHELKEGVPAAWMVNNRNVISKTFDAYEGVIELSVSQHQFNHNTDNRDLMIADYYTVHDEPDDVDAVANYDCRIVYNGDSNLKMGLPFKRYIAEVYKNGEKDDSVEVAWDLVIPDEIADHFELKESGNELGIKCQFDGKMMGSFIRIIAKNEELGCSAELPVKVVSGI